MAGFLRAARREHDRPCRLRSPADPSAPRPRHPPHGTHPRRHSPHQHPPLHPSTTPNPSLNRRHHMPEASLTPTPLGCRLGGETLRQSRQGTLVSVPACLGARLFHNFNAVWSSFGPPPPGSRSAAIRGLAGRRLVLAKRLMRADLAAVRSHTGMLRGLALLDWQQASEGRLPASKSRLRSDSGLLSVEAVTASCLLFTADTWLRAVLVSRHERGGGWEGVCMSSAARGVDPCTKTCRSGVAAGSRSGAKNRHSFRCGLFLVGFFASAGLPWWLRLRGQPETLRRSSRSYRNTNLSQKRPIYHTLETKTLQNVQFCM